MCDHRLGIRHRSTKSTPFLALVGERDPMSSRAAPGFGAHKPTCIGHRAPRGVIGKGIPDRSRASRSRLGRMFGTVRSSPGASHPAGTRRRRNTLWSARTYAHASLCGIARLPVRTARRTGQPTYKHTTPATGSAWRHVTRIDPYAARRALDLLGATSPLMWCAPLDRFRRDTFLSVPNPSDAQPVLQIRCELALPLRHW